MCTCIPSSGSACLFPLFKLCLISKKKTSPRMPHVASQILDERPSHEIWAKKQAVSTMKRSAEFQRPATTVPHRKLPLNKETPNLGLLVTSSDNPHWDFGSIRHIRKASEVDTPMSAVGSVFEIRSAGSYEETPNSSTHSFVAELEDTSPHPFTTRHTIVELRPKSPGISIKSSSSSHSYPRSATPPPNTSQFEQPQTPARLVRSSKPQSYLHPKSPAAITTAELYLDQPKSPDISVRSSRSQSAPQPSTRTPVTSPGLHGQPLPPLPSKSAPHLQPPVNIKSRVATVMENITAIEGDNRQLLERALAAEKKAKALQEMNLTLQNRVTYCDQHHRPKTAPTRSRRAASEVTPISTFNTTPTRHRPAPLNLTPEMKSISRDYDLAARGSPTRPVRRLQPQPYDQASGISGPIPGSVFRQQIMYKGTPISCAPPVATISLAEARRREKPLPFIMPISPSIVPGFVEMECKAEVCEEERRELRKKKTFADLFRWGKRQGCVEV